MEGRPSGIRENATLAALRAGKVVIGAEATTDLRWIPVAYAAAGLDFVWIDLEHTLLDLSAVAQHVQTARLAGITPLVRVPALEGGLIRRLLDNGAQGIILPFVERPEAAAELVSFFRFHPEGRRGASSPLLAHDFEAVAFAEHVRHGHRSTLTCVQIESTAGVEAAAGIARTPGLDLVVVGLYDLSLSLGVPGEIAHPRVEEGVRAVVDACRSSGIAAGVAGAYAGPEDAERLRRFADRGVRFFQCFSDVSLLHGALSEHAERIRRALDLPREG